MEHRREQSTYSGCTVIMCLQRVCKNIYVRARACVSVLGGRGEEGGGRSLINKFKKYIIISTKTGRNLGDRHCTTFLYGGQITAIFSGIKTGYSQSGLTQKWIDWYLIVFYRTEEEEEGAEEREEEEGGGKGGGVGRGRKGRRRRKGEEGEEE